MLHREIAITALAFLGLTGSMSVAATQVVPDAAIVFDDPAAEFSDDERTALRSYLDRTSVPLEQNPEVRPELVRWMCRHAESDPRRSTVAVTNMHILGSLSFNDSKFSKPMEIEACKIDGDLDLSFCRLRALRLRGIQVNRFLGGRMIVDGDVLILRGPRTPTMRENIFGTIDMSGSKIGGSIYIESSTIGGEAEYALILDHVASAGAIVVENDVNLKCPSRLWRTTAGARIVLKGNWESSSSSNNEAIYCRELSAGRIVFRDISVEGELNVGGSSASTELVMRGRFNNPEAMAIRADHVEATVLHLGGAAPDESAFVYGSVTFQNSEIRGTCFIRPSILDITREGRFLNCSGAEVGGDMVIAPSASAEAIGGRLVLHRSNVSGRLSLMGSALGSSTVELTDTRVGRLSFYRDAWPAHGSLKIDGLDYGSFDFRNANEGIDFLKRQHPCSSDKDDFRRSYRPQPYERMVAQFRSTGDLEEWKKCGIEHERIRGQLLECKPSHYAKLIWYKGIGPHVGFGYRLSNILWIFAGEIFLAYGLFRWAARHGGIRPISDISSDPGSTPNRKPKELEGFSPFFFTLDSAIPLTNFSQQSRWLPSDSGSWWFLRWFHLFLILSGWILTTGIVAIFASIPK